MAEVSEIWKTVKKLGGMRKFLEGMIADARVIEDAEKDTNRRRYLTRLRLDLENTLFNYEDRYRDEVIIQQAVDKTQEEYGL